MANMLSSVAASLSKVLISLGIGFIVESLPLLISITHASWQPLLVDLLLSTSHNNAYRRTCSNGAIFYFIVFTSLEPIYHTLWRLLRLQKLFGYSKNQIHVCQWVKFQRDGRCPVHHRPEEVKARREPTDYQRPQLTTTVEKTTRRPIETRMDVQRSFYIRKPGFKGCLVPVMKILTRGRHLCLPMIQKSRLHWLSLIHGGVYKTPLNWIASSIFQQALLARANTRCFFDKQRSCLSERIGSLAFAIRSCLDSGSRGFRLLIGLINTFPTVLPNKVWFIRGFRPQRSLQGVLETLQNKMITATTWMYPAKAHDVFAIFVTFKGWSSPECIPPTPTVPGAFPDEDNGEAPWDTRDRQDICPSCKADLSDATLVHIRAVSYCVYLTACAANRYP